ncbi:Signal recognition particle protein [Buchnera aphidicola (Anoecia corni)]|uniref:signal-recognition-particle GTPase n=1 Tax=Buchnera aphidicola (Anoecia corni) TaxID=2994477 RepID=A0AAT9IGU0_9GAMM
MFYNLAKKISKSIFNISNKGKITESNIQKTLRNIRTALLEADVALKVVKKFILDIKNDAIGKTFNNSFTPGQEFIKIVKKQLICTMSSNEKNDHVLNMSTEPPAVFLLVGAQGMGKTTTVGKLALFIKKEKKKKILIASTDIYRPAAIEQLETLSKQASVDFFPFCKKKDSILIAKEALKYAKVNFYDVLLLDTVGIMYSNIHMMHLIQSISNVVNPIEILLVIDAMVGQDAINMIEQFNTYLPISGIILTKIDSDARGGIALSIKYSTGKIIKLVGTGEKIYDIKYFQPKKIAERILGMENVLSVIQEIENKIDRSSIKKIKKTFSNKTEFNLYDFLIQLKQINKIGNIENILERLPNNKIIPNDVKSNLNSKLLKKFVSIINSMTKKERLFPNIIKGSRKRRIALGSGFKVQDINNMLKQFENVKRLVKSVKKTGISNIIKNISNFFPNKLF